MMDGVPSDLELMDLHIPTLYVCDPDGRLRYIREPGDEEAELGPAPRFFMGRTREGNVWRFRHDLPARVVQELEELCRTEPALLDLRTAEEDPRIASAIRAVLAAHAPLSQEYRGPAYAIPEPVQSTGNAVLISEANAHLLEAHFPWTLTSRAGYRFAPIAAAVAEGRAVSICFCSRLTSQAAEAGVETAEAFRGQGHASAAVAAWAAAMQERGRLTLYGTQWNNAASRGVARNVGAVFYGEDWWIA